MNPNSNDPSTTPPADGTNPVPPVAPETPAAPVTPPAPGAPEAPVQPVAPAQPEAPVNPFAPATPPAPATPEAPVTPGTPVSPVPPVAPETSNPFTAGTPTTAPDAPQSPKITKKMMLIAAIVGGAILLAIIGVILFFVLTTVSKEDYRDAVRQYNKVQIASSSLNSDVSRLGSATSSSSDSAFNESIEETEASLAKIKTENEALSKLKAVKVGEGAKLYKAFNEKLKAYLTYGEGLITSVKNLRPAMVTCDKGTQASDAATRVAGLKACSTELAGVSDIPNAEMKTYITALSEGYAKYAEISEKVAALTNPYGSQYEEYKALRDQMYDELDTISAAADTFSDALSKRDDELSVKESADKLGDFLSDQQKK